MDILLLQAIPRNCFILNVNDIIRDVFILPCFSLVQMVCHNLLSNWWLDKVHKVWSFKKRISYIVPPKTECMASLSYTYLTPHFIVMEVHESPSILLYLPSIHKHLGKAQAIADVSWAAAPLPALFLVVETLLLFITPAATQGSLGAGGRDSMGNPSSDDGISESCLFTPCKKRTCTIQNHSQ